ncbi:hypothetical protein [Amphiplicatus metriothermophilus]|uniref:Uncharacterized protein n=1 Tax=Amphiplicatus metriothermophilus TaxID=1519374 RepID=A0A239PKM0_9PROT|nr:hypothetical protein [Amphiplicatus metriothermophilus]MBB5517540.1 hypothetical protein [Amphiplicatus metriothermophilus]SNT68125.1 hypothetical protein SAMN06297382_0621 [Amphiplicatus metriothermophilus]
MGAGFDPGAAFVAAIVATAGLWWFRLLLKKEVGRLPAATRYGVYALIWLAYFVLTFIIARQVGGTGG